MTGFIYVMRSADRVKIGHSMKPDLRLSKVASDSPFPVKLISMFPGSQSDEAEIHAQFSCCRRHGEWFDVNGPLSAWIYALPIYVKPPRRRRDIGTELSKAMQARNLTDAAVAVEAGCDRSMITKVRNGTAEPSLPLAVAISRATGVDIEALMRPAPQEVQP
jgi:DNA-binding XRE family transcriptional regulator